VENPRGYKQGEISELEDSPTLRYVVGKRHISTEVPIVLHGICCLSVLAYKGENLMLTMTDISMLSATQINFL